MTVATQIFDNLATLVTTTLPGYVDLPEAYDVNENASHLLKKGFAIGFQSEVNDKLQLTNMINFEREFSIILVNKITTTFNNRSDRVAIEKALIEDGYSLIKATCRDLTLGGVATVTSYEGETGIEYITDLNGTEKFVSIGLIVAVKYQDTF